MAVEGSGALPAGTYRPTAPTGRVRRSQTTPGEVSTRTGLVSCASWKRETLAAAVVIAWRASGGRRLGNGHVLEAHIGIAAGQAELADDGIGTPVADALGDLGGQCVGGVAQKQQIRLRE